MEHKKHIPPIHNHNAIPNFFDNSLTPMEILSKLAAKINDNIDSIDGLHSLLQTEYWTAQTTDANINAKLGNYFTKSETVSEIMGESNRAKQEMRTYTDNAIGNGNLVIKNGDVTLGTFSANQSTDNIIDLGAVPIDFTSQYFHRNITHFADLQYNLKSDLPSFATFEITSVIDSDESTELDNAGYTLFDNWEYVECNLYVIGKSVYNNPGDFRTICLKVPISALNFDGTFSFENYCIGSFYEDKAKLFMNYWRYDGKRIVSLQCGVLVENSQEETLLKSLEGVICGSLTFSK